MDVQCSGHGLFLCLFNLQEFRRTFVFWLLIVTVVPVNILVLLPSTRGRVDRVAEVVLFFSTERMPRCDYTEYDTSETAARGIEGRIIG